MKHALAPVFVCWLATAALAAGASRWIHTSESDFNAGTLRNVVATNLGDLKLSRAVQTLMEQDPRVSAVFCLAEAPDGAVYAGTGPHGIVLRIADQKPATFLSLDDESVFSLLVEPDGRLLVGTGGEKGRLLRVDPKAARPVEIFTAAGVQYIWRLVRTADGVVYAATGPAARIYEIRPGAAPQVLFEARQNNVLSLISDGGDVLYAGTDPDGLVYRIDRKTRTSRVLFDAPESEITALALDRSGNLFAATGQALDGSGPSVASVADRTGRPETAESSTPLPGLRPVPPPRPERPPASGPPPIPRANAAGDPQPPAAMQPAAVPPAPPAPPRTSPQPVPVRSTPGRPTGPASGSPGGPAGNAIYQINPDGFVTEVFRQAVVILSILEKEGVLLAGTGNDGLLYQINPVSEETTILAKVDSRQILALLPTRDGRTLLALANVAGVSALSAGYATEGTYTSPVLDAGQVSWFGKMRLVGSLPTGTTLSVCTRSGNVQRSGEDGWSAWSEPAPATEFWQIPSPAARFLQYRLTFASADGRETPVVEHVEVAYQVPNLAPRIRSIRVTSAGESAAGPSGSSSSAGGSGSAGTTASHRIRNITWEASDPNGDPLRYELHFRSGTGGNWILLAEDLKEPRFTWDTRGVSDGRYQLRVLASDAKANPVGLGRTATRVSDPVIVDNTPPVIGDLKLTQAEGNVSISCRVVDATGIVSAFAYAVNSADDWQAVPASDKIFDSPEETVSFTVEGLSAGTHQIALRASDDRGNMAHESVQVTVGPAARAR
jgi:hypothetical protein